MKKVEPYTIPPAGIDTVHITLEETYDVQGVGEDTVQLKGVLVADRGAPLLGHGNKKADWENATVVARFTSLNVSGESKIFGPVHVTLDHSVTSFGAVTAGKCAAALGVVVSMPQHDLTLRSSEPIQLQSTVKTVPPIGDERTESVAAVKLVDHSTKRERGTIKQAHVVWRELISQLAR